MRKGRVISMFDFTVSPGGLSLRQARDAIRARRAAGEDRRFSVSVAPGIYSGDLPEFGREDGNTDWVGENAVLSGGFSVRAEDMQPLSDAEKSRLCPEAAQRVRKFSLRSFGFSPDDWGKLRPIGAFSTARKYDGVEEGMSCELFADGRRMTLARYPNEGFLHIDGALDVGDVREFPEQNYFNDWDQRRNHRGGAYIIDRNTALRAKGWREPEKAWMYGFFYHDWADSSTPVASLDAAHRTVRPAFVSSYGCRRGGRYYFYNVLEELDAPGEWYLDRDSGELFLYPPEGMKEAELSLSERPVISVSADGMRFSGFDVRCARADGISVNGNGNIVENCRVSCVSGDGVTVSGYGNTVRRCEITRTGGSGVILNGGDRADLRPGGNTVEDCFIHGWAEVAMTYHPGVGLYGVGNSCVHNELRDAPHSAIIYGGNCHLIEYNLISDVVRLSNDAGAIYSGMDWAAHGTVIRCNLLRNIGSGGFRPNGIYWDDALSGQTACDNLLINVAQHAFLIGGGRDNTVLRNVIINPGESGIEYDARARDAVVADGWAREAYAVPGGVGWRSLDSVPYESPVWAERFPTLQGLSRDFSQPDDPAFPPNPAGSTVEDNVIVSPEKKFFDIAPDIYRFSRVGRNDLLVSGGPDTASLPAAQAGIRGKAPGKDGMSGE